jgi:predicted nucleic acid-binding protein
VAGLTLDSGALIKYEDQDAIIRAWLDKASKVGPPPVVPTVVIAEVWRGGQRSARVARLLKHCRIRDVTQEIARRAGELMGRTTAEYGAVDAIVAVIAAERGDDLLTSNVGDLTVLTGEYRNVRVIQV